ncbi:MAG: vWA domain-containing protein [Candidatus Aenigmatarchaeota archaeon]
MESSSIKGQMSYTIKSFMLIAGIIAFMILLFMVNSSSADAEEKNQKATLEIQARLTAQNLASSDKCLAYSAGGATQKGIIDIGKLEGFAAKYADMEPECAPEEGFDYLVAVREEPLNVTIYSRFGGDIEFLFNDINGKKTVFLIDVSASMLEPCGTFEGMEKSKAECVGIFLESFIDRLSDGSEIALFVYPRNVWAFEMTRIGGNRDRLKGGINLLTEKGTPMCVALGEAYEYAKKNRVERIVLLTDGCENSAECWVGNSIRVTEENMDAGIPIHAIAFGEDVEKCTWVMKEIANRSAGYYYRAADCEELAGKTPQYTITSEEKTWTFGTREYSPEGSQGSMLAVTLPVTIRHDQTNSRKATLTLEAIAGELETLGGKIEKACRGTEGYKDSFEMELDHPINCANKRLCISAGGGACKNLNCNPDIDFMEIPWRGSYAISIEKSGGKVIVRT